MTKTGPLAAAGAEGIFFANTGVSDNKAVDFEIQFVPGIFGDQNNLKGEKIPSCHRSYFIYQLRLELISGEWDSI